MKIEPLAIQGAWLCKSDINSDNRGFLVEWFKESSISRIVGHEFSIKQGNISKSSKGVLRGIHYSLSPEGQEKWITCVSGSVLDLIIDLRETSSTYKEWIQIPLKAGDGKAILIGNGLGHAILSLEDNTIVSYLLTSAYAPNYEFSINPLDPDLRINWPKIDLILSTRDRSAPLLKDITGKR